jgi:NAD+ synthase
MVHSAKHPNGFHRGGDEGTRGVKDGFNRDILQLDAHREIENLCSFLRTTGMQQFRRRGVVVGISGGIDSSVVAAICVKALGPERVLGILMPEKESSDESSRYARELAMRLGIETCTEDISAALEGLGCYRRRDEAIRRVFPEYGPGWKSKISLPGNLIDQNTLNFFYLTVIDPDGMEFRERISNPDLFQIIAASNFKQRARMSILYYHAEEKNFLVVGTANKNEYDLGFFVKYGDGGVDIQLISHLYKSQVYQLARFLDIPQNIQERVPTTDTYSAGSTQEEFFFRVPFETLDTIWCGYEHSIPTDEIAQVLGLEIDQVERVISDIVRKQKTTQYLRTSPVHYGVSQGWYEFCRFPY